MITKELHVPYLANIISVIHADGAIQKEETDAMESICQRIEADQKDLEEAIRCVAENRFRLTPVGRFSDKVRNLEDMVFVAMKDGNLAKEEKALVLSFAKNLQITQEQFRTIVSETKLKIDLQRSSRVCGKCGQQMQAGARFCTECGTPC
jgi:uncharacterized tellurite resistance protein B-like protein